MMTTISATNLFRWISHATSEDRRTPVSPRWLICVLPVLFVICFIVILVGPVTGWVRLFAIPSAAMAPTIAPGDRFASEAFSLMTRAPRRGELILFRTDGIKSLLPNQVFVKRIVGLPGERVQIANGKLSINGSV